jgi:hypothetical protein
MWPARPFLGYNKKARLTRIEQEVTEGLSERSVTSVGLSCRVVFYARILTKRAWTRKYSKKKAKRQEHGWTQIWCSKIDAAPFPTGQKINSQELRARLPVF